MKKDSSFVKISKCVVRPHLLARRCSAMFAALLAAPLFSLPAVTIDLSKPVSESLKPDGIYWTFDDGMIGEPFPLEVEDHSGNGYDGKMREGMDRPLPVYDEGRFGKALRFLPFPEGYTYVPNHYNPQIIWRLTETPGAWDETKLDMERKSFTGGVWVKLDEIFEGQFQLIYLFEYGRKEPHQWSFFVIKDAEGNWKLHLDRTRSEAMQEFETGIWHHLAFSLEMDGDAGYVTFWVDGNMLGDPVALEKPFLAPESDTDRFFILGEHVVGSFANGFAGLVDDAFITSGVHTFTPVQR